ncbi:MAG: FUSC family protein [Pseudonocardia sp.]|nr:FUSC family protein [Pseudonocardia sp.]
MTPRPGPSGLLAALRSRDPGWGILRRALRVSLAACVVFYLGRYVLDDRVVAVYAVFGVVALGALSDVSGPPRHRTRTMLGCLAAGLVLVTIGTLVAVSTATAVVGMLVVAFAVAFAGVGGPRFTGVANGVHLFFILPCFPPYAPDTLPARLLGLAMGVLALVLADRLVLPDPGPPGFRSRLREAAGAIGRHLDALLTGDERLPELRAAARGPVEGLRLSTLPLGERPAGPGARDRGLTHAADALRAVEGRILAITAAAGDPPALPADVVSALSAVRRSLVEVCAALGGEGPPPDLAPVDAAIAEDAADRLRRLTAPDGVAALLPEAPLRVAALEALYVQRTVVLAVRAATGAPEPPEAAEDTGPGGPFWYVGASWWSLWRHRLGTHLTLRSVYLQNAVRLAIGLAAARWVAGGLELQNGFWVLLATLSLMRTSVTATRSALVPAFAGTLVGAVVAAGLLATAGPDSVVYAVVFPVFLVAALAGGPLLGPAVGQGLFTILVTVLFAQLSPASWSLAGVRILDVVVGGLVGILIGVAVWPRGGRSEVRRAAARCLAAGADHIQRVADALAGRPRTRGPGAPTPVDERRLLVLLDAGYAQYRSEPHPRREDPVDWLAVVGAAHRLIRGAAALRRRFADTEPLPWPPVTAGMRGAGHTAAEHYRVFAAALARDVLPAETVEDGRGTPAWVRTAAHECDRVDHPEAMLRVIDLWGWLSWLTDDLARVARRGSAQDGLDVDVDP